MFILPSAVNAGGKNSIMRITDTSDNKKTYTDTIIADINSIRKYKTEMKGKRKMYKKKEIHSTCNNFNTNHNRCACSSCDTYPEVLP